MSHQGPPQRKPLPALRLFEPSDSDHTGVQERLGFAPEESTMITSLERLEGAESTGVSEVNEVEPIFDESPSEVSTDPAGEVSAEERRTEGQRGGQVTPPPLAPPPLGSLPSLREPPAFQAPLAQPVISQPVIPQPVIPQPIPVQQDLEPPAVSVNESQTPLIMSLEEQHRPTDELPSTSIHSAPPASSLESAVSTVEGGGTGQRGVMITGFNARGGVGSTSLLLSLAGALQSRGFKVVIVDMDLQLATLSSSLEVKLERSLAELVMEAQASAGPIRSAFDQHKSGVAVVAQEERISEISNVTPERLPRFFDALRQGFDVVLVDGLRSFSDIAVAVMDEADMVLLPVTQDIPAVRSARKVIKLFARLGYEGGKSRVVLNRFHKRAMVNEEVIEEHLRCVISERLPNDFRFVAQGLAEGELLHFINPKHPFCLAVDRLAAQLMGFPAPVQRQGLLSRLLGR